MLKIRSLTSLSGGWARNDFHLLMRDEFPRRLDFFESTLGVHGRPWPETRSRRPPDVASGPTVMNAASAAAGRRPSGLTGE
jgi:hypothetical protein